MRINAITIVLVTSLIIQNLSFQYCFNGNCQLCYYRCRTCSGTQDYHCNQCNSEYRLQTIGSFSYGHCQPCSFHCKSCFSVDRCETCDPGYYLSQATGLCIKCSLGASLCTLSATQKCAQKYQELNGMCVPCVSHCLQCTNEACNSCEPGYYISQTRECLSCEVANCAQCPSPGTSPNTCFQCIAGYTGTICEEQCTVNCAICFGTTCYACLDNFQLKNNKCISLSLLCKSGTLSSCQQCLPAIAYKDISQNCIPSFNTQKSTTQIYLTSLNNDNAFSLEYSTSNTTMINQILRQNQCGERDIIQAENAQLSFSFETTPIHQFSFKIFLYLQGSLINNLQISVYLFNKQNHKMTRKILQQNNIDLNAAKMSQRQCEPGKYLLTTPIIVVSGFSTSQQVYNSTSQSILISISTDDRSYNFGISQILINIQRCATDNCEICQATYTCISCVYPLLLNNNECVQQCSTGYYLAPDIRTCTLECPIKYYPIFQDFLCISCKSPCQQCSSESYCITCQAEWYLHNGLCLLECPSGYYQNIQLQKCERCLYPCLDCNNARQCISCLVGYLHIETNTCSFKCPQSTYLNFSTLSCQQCELPCLTCESQSLCKSCIDGLYLDTTSKTCVNQCPPETFEKQQFSMSSNQTNSNNGTCAFCQYPCQECVLYATKCSSCLVGYLFNQKCIDRCPDTHYQYLKTCRQCQSPCETCQNQTHCLTCKQSINQTIFFYNNWCYQICPIQTYSSQNQGLCINCKSPCNQCLNATYCLSCVRSYLFIHHEGTCYLACPVSTYLTSERSCIPCMQGCFKCIGNGKNGQICSECKSQYYLYEDVCLMECTQSTYSQLTSLNSININRTIAVCQNCSFPCTKCITLTKCTQCAFEYYLSSNNKCKLSCQDNTYPSDQNSILLCLTCPQECSKCINQSVCSQCRQNYYLFQEKCINICPVEFYAHHITQSCRQCQLPCLECVSAFSCISCFQAVDKQLYLYQHKCISQCPSGAIGIILQQNNTYVCQKCSQECLTCQNIPQYCTSCKHLTYLVNGSCYNSCLDGYYKHQSRICSKCQIPCQTCITSPDYCTDCLGDLYLFGGVCYEQCLQNYYSSTLVLPQRTIKLCKKCSYPCKSCDIQADNCTSCFGSKLYKSLYVDNSSEVISICVTQCSEYMYPNKLIKQCLSCSPYCQTCIDEGVCLSCSQGLYLINKKCVEQCPDKYYSSDEGNISSNATNRLCLQCQSPCEECIDQQQCKTCEDSYYFLEGMCVTTCPSKYYSLSSSGNTKECHQCPSYCDQCYDFSACKSCNNNSTRPYLQQKSCVAKCSQGFFLKQIQFICLSCSSNCITCASQQECYQCTASYLWNKKCIGQCPEKTYGDTSMQCLSCREPCLSCYDSNSCKTCYQGYFLYLKFCLSHCPEDMWSYPHIRECRQTCTLFKDSSNKMCLQTCPIYYRSDYQCTDKCQQNEIVNSTLGCQKCQNQTCQDVPYYRTQFINSGINLYIAAIFSKPMQNINTFSIDDSSYKIDKVDYDNEETVIFRNVKQQGNLENSNNTSLLLPSQILDMNNSQVLYLKISADTHGKLVHRLQSLGKLVYNKYPLQNNNYSSEVGSINLTDYKSVQYFQYLGIGVSAIFICLFLFNLFLDNTRVIFITFDILQSVALILYLQVWFHPSIQNFMKGLNLMLFKGINIKIQAISNFTEIWTCSTKKIYHNQGCNPSKQLIQISAFLILSIILMIIGKIILTKYRKNKHKICWNHINNLYWIFGFSIFHTVVSIQQPIVSIIAICLFILISLLICYQTVKNIFKNTYAETTFFWNLKKSKAKNPLDNSYYVMAMCRRLVIVFSVSLSAEKPIFPISFITINTLLIIVNDIWNKPYKKYGFLLPLIQILYCLFLFLLLLIIVNYKQISGSVWQGLSLSAFVVLVVIICVMGYICIRETIIIVKINWSKIRSLQMIKQQGKIVSEQSQSNSKSDSKSSSAEEKSQTLNLDQKRQQNIKISQENSKTNKMSVINQFAQSDIQQLQKQKIQSQKQNQKQSQNQNQNNIQQSEFSSQISSMLSYTGDYPSKTAKYLFKVDKQYKQL